MWFNITSLTWEEQERDYIEDYVVYAGYNETKEGSGTIISTVPMAHVTVNTCKPGPNMNWTQCKEVAVPYTLKSGITTLPKPWRNRCP